MQLVLSQEITPHRCPPRPELRPAQPPLCDQFVEFQQKRGGGGKPPVTAELSLYRDTK